MLNCVVTEVVLFSIVAFKTLTFHKVNVPTHLKCGGIFIVSDSIKILCSPGSDSEISLKIGQYIGAVEAYEVKA